MRKNRKKYVIREGSILDKISKFMKLFDVANNEKVMMIWIAIIAACMIPFVVVESIKAFVILIAIILFGLLLLEVYDDKE